MIKKKILIFFLLPWRTQCSALGCHVSDGGQYESYPYLLENAYIFHTMKTCSEHGVTVFKNGKKPKSNEKVARMTCALYSKPLVIHRKCCFSQIT